MLSANLIKDIKLLAYKGFASRLENICDIYPVKVSQIIEMGENRYKGYLGILLLSEVEIAKMIKEKTEEEVPLENIDVLAYLLQSADLDDNFFLELQTIFSTFIKEDILFLPKINSILIGSPEERRLITSKNFRDFLDILRILNKYEIKEPPPENETPGERKMRLLREKRDAVKRKQQQKKNDEGQSFLDLVETADVFGIDTGNCTIYAFYDLLKRYLLKEKWEQDLMMLCAGVDSSKMKTQYWGGSLKED